MENVSSSPTSRDKTVNWDPKTFTSRDLAEVTCPTCDEDLTLEVFVGRLGQFNGFEMSQYEETGRDLVTWVCCSGCGQIYLSRSIVAAAQAEELYEAGRDERIKNQIKCEAEDQGGWACCVEPAIWRTVAGIDPPRNYCREHRINKHIWTEEEAARTLEPIPQDAP